MKNVTYFSFLFFIFGCVHNHTKEECGIRLDENKITPLFSDLFEPVKIVLLEDHEDSYFYRITRFELTKDRLFLYDQRSQTTFVFTREGKFLFNTTKLEGEGGKHMNRINDFIINPWTGNMEFLNPSGSIYMYDQEAQFVNTIVLPKEIEIVNGFALLNEDTYVLYRPGEPKSHLYYYSISKNKLLKHTEIKEDMPRGLGLSDIIFTPFYRSGDTLYFSSNRFGRNIFRINPISYELEKEYELNFGKRTLTRDDLKKKDMGEFAESEMFNYPIMDQKSITSDYIICSFLEKKEFYTAVYDRKENKTIYFPNRFPSGDLLPVPWGIENNNTFVALVNATYLKDMFAEGRLTPSEKQKFNELNEDSNHAFIFYTFKKEILFPAEK